MTRPASTRPRRSTGCCRRSTGSATPSRAASCASWSRCSPTRSTSLAESLEQLYDDQFIETCAEWVAPYIGDLIGYRTLHGVVPQRRLAARRGRQHDPLPPPQGHGVGARAARPRRHRLAGPRGRVLRAAGDDAVHEPRPAARGGDGRPARRGPARARRHLPWPAPSTTSPTPPRCGASASRVGPLQHPQRRHLPLARRAPAAGALAAGRGGRLRAPLPLRPAGQRRAALRRAADRDRDHPHRRAVRRPAAARPRAGSRRISPPTTAPAARCCWRSRPRAATDPVASADDPRLRPLRRPGRPGRLGARAAARRHARRARPRARPGRLRGARPPPARRGWRASTTGRRSPSGGGGYDRAASLDEVDNVVLAAGRRGARPAARLGRRRWRGADPRQPPLRGAGDDHGDDAGPGRRRPRARAARGQPGAPAALARRAS